MMENRFGTLEYRTRFCARAIGSKNKSVWSLIFSMQGAHFTPILDTVRSKKASTVATHFAHIERLTENSAIIWLVHG